MNKISYYYIASPYTHRDPAVMQRRYEKAVDFTSWLIEKQEMLVFSPIVHSHPLCQHAKMRPEFDFWMNLDEVMIRPAEGLIVLQIDGWETSRGIKAELELAKLYKKPILSSRTLWSFYDHTI